MSSYLKVFFLFIYTAVLSFIALIAGLADKSQNLYFKLSRVFSGGILKIAGIKLKISGEENIDKKASYIFAANHSSLFDIPAMQFAVPQQTSIVYKKELAKIPLFGWQMLAGPYILIDRKRADSARKSIEEAKRIMSEQGRSVLLFPEGTRSKTGEVQPFKRGAFYLASRVGFPIVPVSISGTDKILPKGKFKLRSGTIHIHYGIPFEARNISAKKDEIELMEKVRNEIIKNMEKGN